MSLGYSAFGSQEWIRKLKPRRFMERRKTPAGENGGIVKDPDIHQLMLKKSVKYGRSFRSFKTFDRPSELAPYTLVMLLSLSIGAAIYFYIC